MKFKLLHGSHINEEQREITRPDGTKETATVELLYRADHEKGLYPIIDTPIDLEKRMNTAISTKFRRIHEEGLSGHTWDPSKETIEQFAMRMSGLASSPAHIQMGPEVIQPPSAPTQDMAALPTGWTMAEIQAYAAEEEISVAQALDQLTGPQATPSNPREAHASQD